MSNQDIVLNSLAGLLQLLDSSDCAFLTLDSLLDDSLVNFLQSVVDFLDLSLNLSNILLLVFNDVGGINHLNGLFQLVL